MTLLDAVERFIEAVQDREEAHETGIGLPGREYGDLVRAYRELKNPALTGY